MSRSSARNFLWRPVAGILRTLGASGPRIAAWRDRVTGLRFATAHGEGEAAARERHAAFRQVLSAGLHIPIEILWYPTYSDLTAAWVEDRIDLACTGPKTYADLFIRTGGGVRPLVILRDAAGGTSYQSLVVVRANSPAYTLADLRGARFGFTARSSASGYMIPALTFRAGGFDPETHFGKIGFAGNHINVIRDLMDGRYDAVATWGSWYGAPETGFIRSDLRLLIADGTIKARDLRVIWRSDPIPNEPVVVRSDVPEDLLDDLRRFFILLPRHHPELYQAIHHEIAGEGYVAARRGMFLPIIELCKRLADDAPADRQTGL